QGNNALTALLYLFSILPLPKSDLAEKLRALSKLFPHGDTTGTATGIAMSDEESGALTISLNMLKVDNGKIQATFDCRAPISATKETLGDILENEAKAFGFSLEQAFQPAHLVPEDTPFIQTLLKCYEQYTGKKGSCLSTGGGTYVHDLKNGVAFGCSMPETDNRMHGADEFAIVEELITGAKIFTQAIIDLCGA
ncbi:MAG TPA: peptidase M20, partial [Ruminococcaceae bacterium]|nr:peptidase M20 [Oscillospiraceae bacterium]